MKTMQAVRTILSHCIQVLAFLMISQDAMAQGGSSAGSRYLIVSLLVVGALILISAIVMLSDNLISIEAKNAGLPEKESKPFFNRLFGAPAPSYVGDASVKRLSKGHDILLEGAPSKEIKKGSAKRYSVSPSEYRGMSPIPKVVVAVGDEVEAGDVLFFDKKNDKVKYVAPVSGEVVEIRRGAKRAITDVIILADEKTKYRQLDPPSIKESSREDIVDFLCANGGWTLLNQRPYDVVPSTEAVPKGIFISTFDTAPFAPDGDMVVAGREEAFQKGIDTLARLTDGKVHLGLDASGDAPSLAFTQATNCEKHWFAGKHPAGNVGVQIHHIDPIKPGEKAWTLAVQDVITLGDMMYKGIYNTEKVITVAGSRVASPSHVSTHAGASINELLNGAIDGENNRVIDGDVLSGGHTAEDTFMRAKSDQLTVIPEGDEYELFGWLLPLKSRPSISKTFPNFLMPSLRFDANTNTHGERRAFVMTGQYESVMPMDIYPQHLMKAILANDYERMEGLGITELSEEDVALCEFVCTSKQPLQRILREGLDMMRDQE